MICGVPVGLPGSPEGRARLRGGPSERPSVPRPSRGRGHGGTGGKRQPPSGHSWFWRTGASAPLCGAIRGGRKQNRAGGHPKSCCLEVLCMAYRGHGPDGHQREKDGHLGR